MTATTDLLRKAARLHEGVAKSAEHRGEPPAVVAGLRRDAASLLALADQMERAEPVAWRWMPSSVFRDFVHTDVPEKAAQAKKNGMNVEGLYTHPAPEVTRDARCPDCLGSEFTGWKRGIRCARCDGTGEIAAMQEPKP